MTPGKALTLRQLVVSNLLWFAGSLALAFLVWMTALSQRDPIEERRLSERAPIQWVMDESMLVTSASTETAALRARGQRSALTLLTVDDVTVRANLSELGPGTYTVPLETDVRRDRVIVDAVPQQITVTLELLESRLAPVRIEVAGDLPPGYERDAPDLSVLEVTASGASSRVAQISAAVVRLDLSDDRTSIEMDAPLVAVDNQGIPISGLTLMPSTVRLSISIRQRQDVREVSVQPNLANDDTLPTGYLLTSLSYEPRSVLVSGPSAVLDSLPETFFTAPIELRNRTESFTVDVPVDLPSRDLLILSGGTINVSIGITAQTASRQLDNLPIEIIGIAPDATVQAIPTSVSLLLTGPQPVLDGLRDDDVRVILDLNGLRSGSYQLSPNIQGLPDTVAITVLPSSVDVQILSDLPTATPSGE